MAVEQLKYDFDLNLSKAEKSLDQFVNKAKARMDNISDGLEKRIATATKGGRRASNPTAELERQNRLIERYEIGRMRKRRTMEETFLKSDMRVDAARQKAAGLDPGSQAAELAAYQRLQERKLEIRKEASWKSTSMVNAELRREEKLYTTDLQGLSGNKKTDKKPSRFAVSRNAVTAAFMVQQSIEDASYAGFRGLSNNLAFLATMIGGPAGIAALSVLAAKNLYDLTSATMGWGNASAEAAARGERSVKVLEQLAEMRQKQTDMVAEFEMPRSLKDLERRRAQLTKDQEALAKRSTAGGYERDLVTLKRMLPVAEAIEELKPGSKMRDAAGDFSAGALKRAEYTFGRLKGQLSRPDSVKGSEDIRKQIEELQKLYDLSVATDQKTL